jgi:hypothetical protein
MRITCCSIIVDIQSRFDKIEKQVKLSTAVSTGEIVHWKGLMTVMHDINNTYCYY